MIKFLFTSKIKNILKQYENINDPFVLRKKLSLNFTAEECRVISSQIFLRKKAKKKFLQANQMFFDTEGLEQASSWFMAKYHASFPEENDVVLDICTGIGADAAAFALKANKVITLDNNKNKQILATENIKNIANKFNIEFINKKFEDYNPSAEITFVYADPSRREKSKRKIDFNEYSPKVSEIISFAEKNNIADKKCLVKLAPACDYDSLLSKGKIQVVSCNGEVKEVLFIMTKKEAGKKEAVLLADEEKVFVLESKKHITKKVSEKLKFIIEPDAAIIRAGLVAEYAEKIGASFIEPHIAYLTSNNENIGPGGKVFCIMEHMQYNEKKIKRFLKKKGIKKITVKKRGINKTTENINKELSIKSGSNKTYLFVFRSEKTHECIIAEKI